MSKQTFLPERSGETDDEKRLREAIDRQASQLLSTLDSAITLRTAPADAARTRHLARTDLLNFALKAMLAQSLCADSA
jgi:hypothetical protein